jgi:hypothetical protein
LVVDVRRGSAADLAGVIVTLEDDPSGLAPSWVGVDLAAGFVAASGRVGALAGCAAALGDRNEPTALAYAEHRHVDSWGSAVAREDPTADPLPPPAHEITPSPSSVG